MLSLFSNKMHYGVQPRRGLERLGLGLEELSLESKPGDCTRLSFIWQYLLTVLSVDCLECK